MKFILKNKYILILSIVIFITNYCLFRIIEMSVNNSSESNYVIYFISSIIVFKCIALSILIIRLFSIKKISSTILLIYFLLEFLFSIIPISMSVPSYQMLNWIVYFYHPKNKLGYRDTEIDDWKNSKKEKILFIGDSFTSGNGIVRIKKRYDKVTEKMLGRDKYQSHIVADQGWGIKEEFNGLVNFPYQPDIVILQIYINDVDDLNNHEIPNKNPLKNFPLAGKISSFFNLIFYMYPDYWLSNQQSNESKSKKDENNRKYLLELDKFLKHCKTNNIETYILFVPEIYSLYYDKELSEKIRNHCHDNNYKFIEIEQEISKTVPEDRIVNRFDKHANEHIHSIFARCIADEISNQ